MRAVAELPDWNAVADFVSRRATAVDVTASRSLTADEIVARHQARRRRQDSLVRPRSAMARRRVMFEVPGFVAPVTVTARTTIYARGDTVDMEHQDIRVNGAAIAGGGNLGIGFATNEIDVGPNPEHIYAHDNIYENNGYEADPFVKNMLGRGFDIIWDTKGADNHFDEKVSSSFPPILPKSSWPQPVYNLYWRVMNFVVGLVS